MSLAPRPSLGRFVRPLVDGLVRDAGALRLGVDRRPGGGTIIDAGLAARGGLEAGRRIAELCMGGLGRVAIGTNPVIAEWPFVISVSAADPVLACLGSQYAGWSLTHDGDGDRWSAMASGPGRASARRESLFDELGYADPDPGSAVLVLETPQAPPDTVLATVAEACGVGREEVVLVLTPTSSLAGTVQIVARVLEVALHKVHALGFPLERVVDGLATVPLPPPSPDDLVAMGRTNDAILFGGAVHLFVTGSDEEAQDLAARLPSASSRDYGKPFAEIFEAAGFDFYKIDSLLFSPASVVVTALASGRSHRAGRVDPDLLARSFGGG